MGNVKRKKFSQRMGLTPIQTEIQVESMDQELNSLWNVFKSYYLDQVDGDFIGSSQMNSFFKVLWDDCFKLPIDTLADYFPK